MSTINCIKLKKKLASLERAPYPGDLGKKILENVSKEAWQMWLEHQTLLINENNLSLIDHNTQNYLKEQMNFFCDALTDYLLVNNSREK